MLSYLTELFYPSTCLMCHRGVDTYDTLCADCLRRLPRTEHQMLRENKIEMLFDDIFHHPRKHFDKPRFIRGGSWLHYDDGVARIIHSGKFFEHPAALEFMGRQAAIEWLESGFFDGIDLLVPVPIHPRRLNERGFNQSEYICRGMQSVLHLPIDTTTLVRVVNTPQQSRLKDNERLHNVEHAFRVPDPLPWHKKHILLVDDVITTGATMRNCIKEITPIRSCRMSVFSLVAAR